MKNNGFLNKNPMNKNNLREFNTNFYRKLSTNQCYTFSDNKLNGNISFKKRIQLNGEEVKNLKKLSSFGRNVPSYDIYLNRPSNISFLNKNHVKYKSTEVNNLYDVLSYNVKSPPSTFLINNGTIKNMFLNNIKKNKDHLLRVKLNKALKFKTNNSINNLHSFKSLNLNEGNNNNILIRKPSYDNYNNINFNKANPLKRVNRPFYNINQTEANNIKVSKQKLIKRKYSKKSAYNVVELNNFYNPQTYNDKNVVFQRKFLINNSKDFNYLPFAVNYFKGFKKMNKKNTKEKLISSINSSEDLSIIADEIVKKCKRYKIIEKNSKTKDLILKIQKVKIGEHNSNCPKKEICITPTNVENFIIKGCDTQREQNENTETKQIKVKKMINKNEIKLRKENLVGDLVENLVENLVLSKKEKTESNDENFSLIEQILKSAENEEKNKKNLHVNFDLKNNVYIYYNPIDLIDKNVGYKDNQKIEMNKGKNDKKMELYFSLLKSKTKLNPIIKSFNKEDIKIDKEYEMNEYLEEHEILGDLYNIFYSKDLNNLDKELQVSSDDDE